MKVIELLNFNRELLKRLQAVGIRLEDTQYIDLYTDYIRLLNQGEKFHMLWLCYPKSIR